MAAKLQNQQQALNRRKW